MLLAGMIHYFLCRALPVSITIVTGVTVMAAGTEARITSGDLTLKTMISPDPALLSWVRRQLSSLTSVTVLVTIIWCYRKVAFLKKRSMDPLPLVITRFQPINLG